MSFQYLFNKANAIGIDKKPTVAQSITRDNTVRSLARGGATWRFTVTMADGMPYEGWRSELASIENLDRTTTETIKLNDTGYTDWFTSYRGVVTPITGWTADVGSSRTITNIDTGTTPTSGDIVLKAGDLVQLGSAGNTYTVVADVVHPATTATLHRPITETGTGIALTVGPECSFDVVCTQFPSWSIFARNQLKWNGSFVFYEVVR